MKKYTRSFNGGIVSPDMWGRIDDLKNNTGLAVCQNFIVLPQGPVHTRAGLRFVRETKNSAKRSRVIPFRFSSSQTVMCEFGEAYIRFHSFAATLLTPTSGVNAWDSGTSYIHGGIVTDEGETWYATEDVPADRKPEDNEYGAAPVVTATWELTSSGNASVPAGYEFVGTELPEEVDVGDKVAISRTTYEIVSESWTGGSSEATLGEIRVEETTVYDAYDGVSSSATAGYWFKMGEVYEIPSPYAEVDIPDIGYAQAGDVLTLTHPKYPVMELRRFGPTFWRLVESEFGSEEVAPTISSVAADTATDPSDTITYKYVATNVSEDQLQESVASGVKTASNQLFDTGATNTITFSAAGRRNVYKYSGGLYGYIGQTTETTLVDDNIAADVSRTPPENIDPFNTDYPRTVAYFEQRKVFAGTLAKPQNFWMTKTGTESNLDRSIPVRADDGISIKLADLESSTIRHAVPVGDLILFTDSAEWKVSSSDGGPITPSTVSVRPQSRIGANRVQPVVAAESIIYSAARGGHIRALGYDFEVSGYVSVDLSLRATHLFDYKTIEDMAYAKGPVPIVWAVSSDGQLLGLTYVPEQQVYAWHRHRTAGGTFESCAIIEEGNDSILYAIVRREIDGEVVRYVEAMASLYYSKVSEYVGLDSSISYSGAAEDTFTNLDHLEGEEVYALADGAVMGPYTVASGSVTIDQPAETVRVGKRITAEMTTLPLVAELEAYLNGTIVTIRDVTLRLYRSGRVFVGLDSDSITETKNRTVETYGEPPSLVSKEEEVLIQPNWDADGQVYIRAQDPLPVMITAHTVQFSTGG
ncbi:hypothetical protein [Henriciella sp.]|uniref:hypothetical protein n=1 Tax=Henriciella sp. TaxID=1968823 RepID=UPI0026326CDD|nr:hypothetical protein [Henriciella sp.]